METLSRSPVDAVGVRANAMPRDRLEAGDVDHAVSWSAIVAGASAAAALSLILLILGTGLGLASISPWTREGISAKALGVTAILWLTATQLLASGMGGYIAGRLGAQWKTVHTDEAYFRDTAHGFLAWAVASLATAALLTSVIGSIVGTGVQATAAVSGGVAAASAAKSIQIPNSESAGRTSSESASLSYLIGTLFRKDQNPVATTGGTAAMVNDAERTSANSTAESSQIFMNAIRTDALLPEDVRYLGQVISQRTGVSQSDAEKRVTTAYARLQASLKDAEVAVREAAEKARKASAYSALWLFISLLIGAFCASLAATYGGRQRRA